MIVTRALGERTQAMIDTLASISSAPDKLTRLYLTPEHKRAAHLVGDWMRKAGLAVRMDAAGTMHGLLAGSGPGLLGAVGYMDPGSWAAALAGGAQFGYTLLSVVMISNLMAILL